MSEEYYPQNEALDSDDVFDSDSVSDSDSVINSDSDSDSDSGDWSGDESESTEEFVSEKQWADMMSGTTLTYGGRRKVRGGMYDQQDEIDGVNVVKPSVTLGDFLTHAKIGCHALKTSFMDKQYITLEAVDTKCYRRAEEVVRDAIKDLYNQLSFKDTLNDVRSNLSLKKMIIGDLKDKFDELKMAFVVEATKKLSEWTQKEGKFEKTLIPERKYQAMNLYGRFIINYYVRTTVIIRNKQPDYFEQFSVKRLSPTKTLKHAMRHADKRALRLNDKTDEWVGLSSFYYIIRKHSKECTKETVEEFVALQESIAQWQSMDFERRKNEEQAHKQREWEDEKNREYREETNRNYDERHGNQNRNQSNYTSHNPMYDSVPMPVATKIVKKTEFGDDECDIEDFDQIVEDLDILAEQFSDRDVLDYARVLLGIPSDDTVSEKSMHTKIYRKITMLLHSDKTKCSADAIKRVISAYSALYAPAPERIPEPTAGGRSKGSTLQYSSMFAMCAVTLMLGIFQ